ncbi:hypothetical protein pneo_cds_939 [Pandoravirus neocaledonia]|uniref:Uncharacterized protein n=1 Tax=Pandoravirus neocaledonia TaxID=2107708 RepID=A0A2U7UDP7_9VIRU|nr:hypothetical protein pneo_cds_939 [Pandoravirus neocaledonia]AVK76546.1 hypothetical protein pneo_cds_939 [Pandoravirus neocaledonia]
MPRVCPESPRSPTWVYGVVILGFVVAVVLYGGLLLAQKRVFPAEARLYGTPVPPHIVRHSSSDLAWDANNNNNNISSSSAGNTGGVSAGAA